MKTNSRCAIYTRKSSEEGLEQSFNSLHAQREACEAYVLSQKHEGWHVLSAKYDDGGFSGGNMVRPGLRKLLDDIAAGKVDTVVVYKVDRLTRSLADFAKIVEAFDGKGVSFVSVTQQFNTTTSMGRLTLNVLLSFAQFEREVTGERIRDKVAASKKKGMWMGGIVPLGYDHKDKRLHVSEAEAKQVRHIFDQYLRLGSVFDLYDYLKENGYRSKQRVSPDGASGGGSVLSRGTLYHLLSNPAYIGKTRHGGKLYEGQHKAIIDQKTWDQTAELLASNRVKRRTSHNLASGRILLGLLFDQQDHRFTPTHSSKKGQRYAYYTLNADDGKATTRLPAVEFEQFVVGRIRDLLLKPVDLAAHFPNLAVKDTRLLVAAGRHRAEQLADISSKESVRLIRNILSRVVASEAEIEIEISHPKLRFELLGNDDDATSNHDLIKLSAPLLIKRRGSEVRLVLENGEPSEAKPIPSLTKAVAWSRHWADQIVNGKLVTMDDLAKSAGVNKIHARRMLRCAALSPALTAQILDGTQPVELTFDKLTRNLPLSWVEQPRYWPAHTPEGRDA
jgi:DNA invertase Pin-like site-specific DNA recombinase